MKNKYPFTDWSQPLDEKKLDAFIEKVREMAYMEFGIDADGDCPLNIHFIDRTIHEPLHFMPIEYRHKIDKDPDKLEERLSDIVFNMRMWSNKLDEEFRIRQHKRVDRREAAKKDKTKK
jgi:ribosomal protein S10